MSFLLAKYSDEYPAGWYLVTHSLIEYLLKWCMLNFMLLMVFYFSSTFWYRKIYSWILIKCSCTWCPKKLYLILKFYFEAATLLMSEILVVLLLWSCTMHLTLYLFAFVAWWIIYAGTKLFSKVGFSQNWNSEEFCHKIFTNMLLSWMFWHSFGLAFCALCHTTCLSVS